MERIFEDERSPEQQDIDDLAERLRRLRNLTPEEMAEELHRQGVRVETFLLRPQAY